MTTPKRLCWRVPTAQRVLLATPQPAAPGHPRRAFPSPPSGRSRPRWAGAGEVAEHKARFAPRARTVDSGASRGLMPEDLSAVCVVLGSTPLSVAFCSQTHDHTEGPDSRAIASNEFTLTMGELAPFSPCGIACKANSVIAPRWNTRQCVDPPNWK